MNRIEVIDNFGPNVIMANGLDSAIIGFDRSSDRLIYSVTKCVEIISKHDSMDFETALEFLEFNTFSAFVGEKHQFGVMIL